MSNPVGQPVFRSNGVTIYSYSDEGTACLDSEARVAPYHSVALPRRGVFTKTSWGRRCTVTTNEATLFVKGESYALSHPDRDGDDTTEISVPSAVMTPLLNGRAGSTRPPRLRPVVGTDGPTAVMHRALVAGLAGAVEVDALWIEECAITIVDRILPAFALDIGRVQAVPRSSEERTARVRWIISRHWAEPLRIGDLAEAVELSPFQLCREFKRVTGSTIHRYVVRMRLSMSLPALLESKATVSSIAHAHGFSSHSHYTSWFRRAYGVTPARLRTQLRSDARAAVRDLGV